MKPPSPEGGNFIGDGEKCFSFSHTGFIPTGGGILRKHSRTVLDLRGAPRDPGGEIGLEDRAIQVFPGKSLRHRRWQCDFVNTTARSKPFTFGMRAMYFTPGCRVILRATSSASLNWGTHFGGTNDVIWTPYTPVLDNLSIKAILRSVGIQFFSIGIHLLAQLDE